MTDINFIPYAAALFVVSGFVIVWALPFVNLLKARVSDFVCGMLTAVFTGGATISLAFGNTVGGATLVLALVAFIFGMSVAMLLRTVVRLGRE